MEKTPPATEKMTPNLAESDRPAAGTVKNKRSVAHTEPQGQSAGTILTNRSRNMTIITPLDNRKSVRAPSLSKGTRWMHRSTLTMEVNPTDPDFKTTTKVVHDGNKRLPGAARPTPYPTLHSSHFDIGLNKKLYHGTHYKSNFPLHQYDHPNKLHYQSIANWTHNVTGNEMQDVLSRKNHKRDYWSSYNNIHSRLGLERGNGVPKNRETLPTYNILTGQETGMKTERDNHLISGNRVLNTVRMEPEQGLILQ